MTHTPTAAWAVGELTRLGGADKIEISTRRRDGTLRAFAPIWTVTVGGCLYVRSYRGTGGAWYRHATARPAGVIRARGLQRDVTFTPADPASRDAVDAAYRGKYARYRDTYLKAMLADQAVAATLRLAPQS
jgi:hypothetical protein